MDLDGKTTSFGYSGHLLTGITDPNSNPTSLVYQQNSSNRLDHLTDALGNTTFYAYFAPGASQCGSITLPCTTVQDANSHTTTYSYQGLEVQHVVDANGNMQTNSYTPDANVTTYTDALSNNTVFNFDVGNTNNLLSITDGNGAKTVMGYTNPNPYLPTTLTDAQNNSMTYGYDGTGNMTSVKDTTPGGTGSSVSYQYNTSVPFGSFLFGTLKQATDGDGNVTTYSYDSVGNLKTVTPPSPLGKETLTVDGVSRVTNETDGNSITTSFTYDNMDRLLKLAYTGGATISYTYDNNGNRLTVVDNTGTTTFTYDKDNRQKTKTLPAGTTLSVTYDPVGNVHTYADAGGTVTYFYDPANRLHQLTEPDGAMTTYGYDKANHKTSISYPNGTGELLGYDGAGHVTSAIGGLMNSQGQITTAYLNFTYNYTAGSSHTQVLQTATLLDPIGHTNSFTRTYGYDSMNRLTSAEVTNSSNQEVEEWGYSYDKAGNRLTSSVLSTGQTTNYSYNGANELTKTVQGSTTVTYNYDGMGNLTSSSNSFSYSYNAKNQTTAINTPGGNNSYTYTGPDQTERVQLNTLTEVYSGLGLSSETNSSGTTFYTRCSCGLLVNERLPGGSKNYYLFDGLGSIVGLTNSSGSEVNAYDYDPYGVILHETTGVVNPWQYAGGYFESSTGLVKFGTRYYNAAQGRWTQQDPVAGSLGQPDSLNRYLYVGDNPVNRVDPSGALSIGCLSAIIGLGYGFIQAAIGLYGQAQGFLAVAAILSVLSTPLGWAVFIATIGISIIIGAALAIGAYEGMAAACGWPTIP